MKINRGNPVIQYRFSLVEILVAIAIIAILLGLSGAGYNAVQRKIARTRTEATLNKIRVGLESYKSKMGYYPQQSAIGPFKLDINDSSAAGQPQNNFNSCIEYGKISKEDSIQLPVTTPPIYKVIDGWKTKNISGNGSDDSGPFILYMCPGLVNTSSYDLFSAGYDRKYKWSSTTDVADTSNTDNIWPQGLKTQ
ncbi:MAG: prepilin-type N-terminal cleavage/methylation domain-containing protein [Lentisphaerota bacterium]